MASNRAPLHLATVSDSRFLPHVATLLNSLAAANRPHDVTMHLLHDGSVTAALQDQLRGEAARLGISIDFLQPTYEALKTLPPSSNYYPSLIWYRVLLPSLLDGLDRVLYLDADTLVLQDLHPIWSTELEGALLAAVPQPWDGQHSGPALTRMGLPSDARYFNSGVLLMNLRAMREQRFQQRVLEIGHMQAEQWADSTHFPLPDQDALNFACFGQWAELHPKMELPRVDVPHAS